MTLLDKAIKALQFDDGGDYADHLQTLRYLFDRVGPYATASRLGVLRDNSAEDFATEFMTAYNDTFGKTY